jgi:ABC-type bacteriocin/lantibiotic exporter with double-glycine peptidase domain
MGSEYFIEHVPQTQAMSCWAASTAMMLGYRRNQSYPESEVLAKFSEFGVDGADNEEWKVLAEQVGLNVLTDACRGAAGWAEILARGPVMVGTPSHVLVVAGIRNEEDDSNAHIKILDPALSGEYWGGYETIEQQYELNPDAGYTVNLFQW